MAKPGVVEDLSLEGTTNLCNSVINCEFEFVLSRMRCGDEEQWDRMLALAVAGPVKSDPLAQAALAIGFSNPYYYRLNKDEGKHFGDLCLPWLLQQRAKSAYFCLGEFYFDGIAVEVDRDLAYHYYKTAADAGCPLCQTAVGYIEKIVKKNAEVGVAWYRRAADQGYAVAQNNLGLSYFNGKGSVKAPEEAVKWFRRAADQGYVEGINALGRAYFNGSGVDQDKVEAVRLYRIAASRGSAAAQFSLADCYEMGGGVDIDYIEAASWLQKATMQGYDGSHNNMGLYYLHGIGVALNEEEAVRFFREGAALEDYFGYCNLGECYLGGIGVEADYEEAERLLVRAEKNGNKRAARLLRELAGKIQAKSVHD